MEDTPVLEKPAAEYSREELMEKFARKPGDVGSPEVQVALLTRRIQRLTQHFSYHHDDKHSMRGMLTLIAQRKKLLGYLRKTDLDTYRSTIQALGLRK